MSLPTVVFVQQQQDENTEKKGHPKIHDHNLFRSNKPVSSSPPQKSYNTTVSKRRVADQDDDNAASKSKVSNKYMELMYGLSLQFSASSPPQSLGNPYERIAAASNSSNFTCVRIYCGNLGEEGLSNSLISFLGLLVHAYHDAACVCDPYVMVEHPRYTNNTREGRRRLTDFLNVTQDPEYWRSKSLPPITYEYHTRWFQKPALFGRMDKVMGQLSQARKLGVVLPKHPVLSNYFTAIFRHPSDPIKDIISRYPAHFTAIHARVEYDFRMYKDGSQWAQSGKNVEQILNITHRGLQMHLSPDVLDEEAFQNVVIAASAENVLGRTKKPLSSSSEIWRDLEGEAIVTDLRRNTTFWGASMQLIEKPEHLSYFEKSLIDMLVCQRATYFVGHYWSTFTKTISFVRHDKSTTFHYGSGELVPIDRAEILDVLITS
eukprot:CAMPEP_0196814258 /NCGR_PEP_ID=MMETSP1362-20130617/42188_1 /TAXON_ID=163516 /ORGANISM="Leptocylindrus danicus, Strain CCMP1856" /LENGTH=431 /DNA_ID=CAMNT_0042190811 /DNA_START=187 /DNA_END=1482 /DNA_ORIENTATION=-